MIKTNGYWAKSKYNPKIIFLALNGIGNIILLTPTFTNLKKNLPDSHISVLTLSDAANVVKNNPCVDNVIVYPSKKPLLLRIIFLLKLRKEKYDVSFYPYPNVNIMSALLALLVGASCKINFYYKFFNHWCGFFNTISVPVNLEKHDVEKNLDLLRASNLKIYSKELFIKIKNEDKTYVDNLLNKTKKHDVLIGMHVGSKESMRVWPTKNFASLIKKLSEFKQIKIILVGTKIEMELIKNSSEFKQLNVINLINKTTIPETTAVIKKCKLFITTDSGPMHMSVAAGTKVIAIYLGPHIKRTAPFGKKHIVFLTNKATAKEDKNKNHFYVDEITTNLIFNKVKKSLRLKH